MKAILRSYFYRLFREKGFYIELGILFGIGFFIALIVRVVAAANGSPIALERALLTAFTGGSIMGSGSIPWFNVFFFIIFGAVRYKKEVDSGAMRNYIVSGYSRKQIYNALYIGNMFFFLCLTLAVGLGIFLPFLGSPTSLASSQVGSFIGAIGLSLLLQCSIATFAYFSFVLLRGHGFSSTFGILVYIGLALIAQMTVLILSLNLGTVSVDTAIMVMSIIGVLPSSLCGAFSSGSLGGVPSGGVLPIVVTPDQASHIEEVVQAVNGRDWTNLNVTAAIIVALLIGIGFYFLGLWLNNRRDLK